MNQMKPELCGRWQVVQWKPNKYTWVESHIRPVNTAWRRGCLTQRQKWRGAPHPASLKPTNPCQTFLSLAPPSLFLEVVLLQGLSRLSICEMLVFPWGAGGVRGHSGTGFSSLGSHRGRRPCSTPRQYIPGVCTRRRHLLLTQVFSSVIGCVEFIEDI